jgi:hypothetical protein
MTTRIRLEKALNERGLRHVGGQVSETQVKLYPQIFHPRLVFTTFSEDARRLCTSFAARSFHSKKANNAR